MDKDLLTNTINLTKKTSLSPKEICIKLGVTERWYYKLMSGEIKNPGVIHVQNLFNLLSKEFEQNPPTVPHNRKAPRREVDRAVLGRRKIEPQ